MNEGSDQRTVSERLSDRFYVWESRGRGWQLWDVPVEPEPAFEPFYGHFLEDDGPVEDDVRIPPLLFTIAKKLFGKRKSQEDSGRKDSREEPMPRRPSDQVELVELTVTLPPDFQVSKVLSEQFLLSLSYLKHPVSFEFIGTSDHIVTVLACAKRDASHLTEQLLAHFPEAVITPENPFLSQLWAHSGWTESLVVDLGLSKEFMLPISTCKDFKNDPLTAVVGALGGLEEGEVAMIQVLFQPVRNSWAESIHRAVTLPNGKPFFMDYPDLAYQANIKIAQPLYGVTIRIAAKSRGIDRVFPLARNIAGALAPLDNPAGNALIPLENGDYDDTDHQVDLVARRTRRSGMILNADELLTLVHLPSASVRTSKFDRVSSRTNAAPEITRGHELVLGLNTHAGQTREVTVSAEQRTRHMYAIGASGTGKSNLLLSLIRQDIDHGEGLAVLDPHGDLVDQILALVPESRHQDVVLLDASDQEYSVGFNILSARTEQEKTQLESDLVAVFRRFSTSWGDQMSAVLGNAILAMLEHPEGGTLFDLRRFLTEAPFRNACLRNVEDPQVVYYWQREFPLLKGSPQASILTRLNSFLRPKPIRQIVVQTDSKLDLATIMDRGQILLAKLPQGAIGEENAYLLGSLLVAKFNQLVMGRQQTKAEERRNFWLYIDEFQHFITPSMASILAGARKYRLGLMLAHQELRQLQSRDADVASAVLTNPYTRICFRVGEEDARKLSDGFSVFGPKDLQNLGIGEAIARVERAEYDFNLKVPLMPPVEEELAGKRRERIQSLSRGRYCRSKEEIAIELEKYFPKTAPEPETSKDEHKRKAPSSERQAKPKHTPAPDRDDAKASTRNTSAPEPTEEPRALDARPLEAAKHLPPPRSMPHTQGRGGPEHKQLQRDFKEIAERLGFLAKIEDAVQDGHVDLALEKGKLRLGIEFSITTSIEHEIGNIKKCLAADFTHVVAFSNASDQLARLEATIGPTLSKAEKARLHFHSRPDLIRFLAALAAQEASHEKTIRGRVVSVHYKPSTNASDHQQCEDTWAKILSDAVIKQKGSSEPQSPHS